MSKDNKQPPAPPTPEPVEPVPFQLDPSHFMTHNCLLDGFIKTAIKDVNKVDFNHNGVPDISEIVPIAAKVLPLIVALNQAVDFEKLAVDLAGNDNYVKDKEVFKAVVSEFQLLAKMAEKLLPH